MAQIIVENKKAAFNYFLIEKMEAGIELHGSEIKSIRNHSCQIKDSYIVIRNGELFILNMHISEYKFANIFNHDPLRVKKLLMHKKEILKLQLKIKQEGFTLVPTKVYVNDRQKVKIEIALAKGKKNYDKRESLKEKSQQREIQKKYRDR